MTDPPRSATLAAIRDLVARYEALTPAQLRAYNETATRNDFIDPLFAALGWNMHDNSEVAREDLLKGRKRVDYAFRTRGVTRFLLEAKRPRVSLNDSDNIRQATDYAWNQGVDWVVLCNFAELRVFYASHFGRGERHRPVLVLHHGEYASRFDDLWLLGRQATETRELARQMRGLPRRQPVDEQLFEDIARWRIDLRDTARAYNRDWTREQGEEAVQRILNRLIFMRSVEDRGIEDPHLVSLAHELMDNPRVSAALPQRLVALFRQLDAVYNERLFAPHFSEDYVGEAQPLVDMVRGLDHRVDGASYNFAAIGADVLGTIYEQYLTQVQAERERRKQQGIYYTPRFIVSYIVRNTLGRALEAARDRGGMAAARHLRVLDLACGSGSFLIAAFDLIDDWLKHHDEGLRDTATRRRHILRENLFGVDLDPQAVEVTRLNLWLRAVDKRELLPAIPNVREGDSLVDEAFDWRREFPQVFAQGGFDVVIGNPPYVRQEALTPAFKRHAATHYRVWSGRADLYVCFYERAHELLRPGGCFGFVSSNKFMRAAYGARLRRYLLDETRLQEIIDFGELPVFRQAATFPVIALTQKREQAGDDRQEFIYAAIKNLDFQDFDVAVGEQGTVLDERSLRGDSWALAPAEDMEIFLQMRAEGVPLKDYLAAHAKVTNGIKTGCNEAFVIERGTRNRLLRQNPKSASFIHPYLEGKDVRKYRCDWQDRYLIAIPKGWTKEFVCADVECNVETAWSDFSRTHPLLAEHLAQSKDKAIRRKNQGDFWWELSQNSEFINIMAQPKVVYPEFALESRCTLEVDARLLNNKCFFIPGNDKYLLGLLNSSVIWFYLKRHMSVLGDADERGRLELRSVHMNRIPIVRARPDDPRRRVIEGCVREALELAPRCAEAEREKLDERHDLARRLAALDAEIDAAVCALYGLSDTQRARVLAG